MRLKQWQNDPDLVAYSKSIVNHKKFQLLMQMLKDQNPWELENPKEDAEDRVFHGIWKMGQGYRLALRTLELSAVEDKQPKQIPQDYKQKEDKE